jgi:hypothetical protein
MALSSFKRDQLTHEKPANAVEDQKPHPLLSKELKDAASHTQIPLFPHFHFVS